MRNLHKEITDRILAQLAQGVAPWRKPWSGQATGSAMPRNAVTGRAYSGVNVILLWSEAQAKAYADPRWLTFKQAKEAGGSVRKGEHGQSVIYVNAVEREKDGETVRIPFLKAYTVFNVAQCDGLSEKLTGALAPKFRNLDERDAFIDEFVASTKAQISHGQARAYFHPVLDLINMPAFATFVSADAYYSTLFHEIGHWTGAKSRLNRDLKGRFGDRAYAAEELIAELTAAFVCAEFGIDMGEAPAAYIATWISLMGEQEKALISAAAAASKAVAYLAGLALEDDALADAA
jgi:antirestriction protein ArdC